MRVAASPRTGLTGRIDTLTRRVLLPVEHNYIIISRTASDYCIEEKFCGVKFVALSTIGVADHNIFPILFMYFTPWKLSSRYRIPKSSTVVLAELMIDSPAKEFDPMQTYAPSSAGNEGFLMCSVDTTLPGMTGGSPRIRRV